MLKCEFYIFVMVIALILLYRITITIALSHSLIIYITNFSLHNQFHGHEDNQPFKAKLVR